MECCLEKRERTLAIMMVVVAGLSTTLLIIAISSDHLVYCHERYSGTKGDILDLSSNTTSVYMLTNFGFWRACGQITDAEGKSLTTLVNIKCQRLSWQTFENVESLEAHEGVENITSAVTGHPMIKVIFILTMLGLLLEIMGHITCLVDRKNSQSNCYMFITGVWYVLSGLSLLATITVLTGLLTEESMHQKELPSHEVKIFRYHYASSFFVLALAFCFVELAAILAVYVFIMRYKVSYKTRHARLHVLKSQSQLVCDLLNKRRIHSASTTEGSRRPSYQSVPTTNVRIEQNHNFLPPRAQDSNTANSNYEYRPIITSNTMESVLYNCSDVSGNAVNVNDISIPPPPMFNHGPFPLQKRCTTTV